MEQWRKAQLHWNKKPARSYFFTRRERDVAHARLPQAAGPVQLLVLHLSKEPRHGQPDEGVGLHTNKRRHQ